MGKMELNLLYCNFIQVSRKKYKKIRAITIPDKNGETQVLMHFGRGRYRLSKNRFISGSYRNVKKVAIDPSTGKGSSFERIS
jgi:hypothetical protein